MKTFPHLLTKTATTNPETDTLSPDMAKCVSWINQEFIGRKKRPG
jgi:hypothetical protein